MSRYRLFWYSLCGVGENRHALKFPIGGVYAQVIQKCFPDVHFGFDPPTKGPCDVSVTLTSSQEVRLRRLMGTLSEHWLLLKNKHLAGIFHGELDECYALDFNFELEQGREGKHHTNTGKLEYEAKENEDPSAAQKLAEAMAKIINNHPRYARAHALVPIPPNPSKKFHLPSELAALVAGMTGKNWYNKLVVKTADTPKAEDLLLAQKVPNLEKVLKVGGVAGFRVILIDDLYQSGSTMWSVARALKMSGAKEVLGLACVKSWRDTDNQ